MKRLVLFVLFSLFCVSTSQTHAFSHFFDFFKEIKARPVQTARLSPTFPWWHPEPFLTPSKRLESSNTPFRTQWQPAPVYLKYRPNPWFDANIFYKQQQDRLEHPVDDVSSVEEPVEYENCSLKGSILAYDRLPKNEYTNRCCECNEDTGKFECEYENYYAGGPQVCSVKDLEITFDSFQADPYFSKPHQKRFFFTFSVKNHATKYAFPSAEIELFLGEKSLQKIKLNKKIEPLALKQFSQRVFSQYAQGVILSDENKDPLRLVITSEAEDPALTKNNEAEELIVFTTPAPDLAISAFSVVKQSEKTVQILTEITNLGALGTDSATGKLQLFVNDQNTPMAQLDIPPLPPKQTITKSFIYELKEPSALFSGKIIPDAKDENEQNNTFEQFFTF
ncbi:hypothetical protein CSB37_00505 [bacterium DOLZORAL124_38_8]|nr:MAG: hypothetical protein CSB37_00505 [bacterium DOLZORAL124_38_8]